jgi:hypothetical protein
MEVGQSPNLGCIPKEKKSEHYFENDVKVAVERILWDKWTVSKASKQ